MFKKLSILKKFECTQNKCCPCVGRWTRHQYMDTFLQIFLKILPPCSTQMRTSSYVVEKEYFQRIGTTLIVSCLLLTKHVSTFLCILRLFRGLIYFYLMYTKIITCNVCIAIYSSFHLAVSLDYIIILWVGVQRSMIIDHLFSP